MEHLNDYLNDATTKMITHAKINVLGQILCYK